LSPACRPDRGGTQAVTSSGSSVAHEDNEAAHPFEHHLNEGLRVGVAVTANRLDIRTELALLELAPRERPSHVDLSLTPRR
jgi:hypothetical protein